MVDLDSMLRHCEAFDGGKIDTKTIREFVLRFQSAPAVVVEQASTNSLTDPAAL